MTRKLIPVDNQELEWRLLDSGLLYAINYLVLRPLGLALALSYEDDSPELPPKLMLMRTSDGNPFSFADEVQEAGRAKLKALLDSFIKEGLAPYNEITLLGAINIKSEPEDFEAHYRPTEFRSLVGTEVLPPLLVREDGQTYMPIAKKNILLAMGGSDRYRPGRIVSLLEKAWRRDNPNAEDGEMPGRIAMPTWLCSIWATLVQDVPGATFVGYHFVIGQYEDRIYLTHGLN